MPLSPAKPREFLHPRRYDFQAFGREDGLWNLEHIHFMVGHSLLVRNRLRTLAARTDR